jgi:phosphoenolpyruvate carboxylase
LLFAVPAVAYARPTATPKQRLTREQIQIDRLIANSKKKGDDAAKRAAKRQVQDAVKRAWQESRDMQKEKTADDRD